ncbi:MAG: methyltransferase [Saprospiraceae bacterium]|nr:methyltransferase [Saprospiraceae bacterium]
MKKQTIKRPQPFEFKQFSIAQDQCTMKVGTDGVLLGAWCNVDNVQTALDIGTGTGVIAIMLGQRNTDMEIHAVEIDGQACAQAKENIKQAPWAGRLQLHQNSIQDFAASWDDKFDLIVSNPPFFTGGTFSDQQDRNNVRHTIKLPHGDLLRSARQLLSREGKFCVILPLIEGLRFEELARTYHLYCTHKTEVLPKATKSVERLLMQFEWEEKPCKIEQLVIQHKGRNEWTDEYIALTHAFYLHM